jgi:hypothetical protein
MPPVAVLLCAAWRADGRLAAETRIHHRAGLWLRGSGGARRAPLAAQCETDANGTEMPGITAKQGLLRGRRAGWANWRQRP